MEHTVQVQTNEHLKHKAVISGVYVYIRLEGLGLTTRETSTRVDIRSQIIPLQTIYMYQEAMARWKRQHPHLSP